MYVLQCFSTGELLPEPLVEISKATFDYVTESVILHYSPIKKSNYQPVQLLQKIVNGCKYPRTTIVTAPPPLMRRQQNKSQTTDSANKKVSFSPPAARMVMGCFRCGLLFSKWSKTDVFLTKYCFILHIKSYLYIINIVFKQCQTLLKQKKLF